jgi:hypothetical protein
MVFVTSIVSSQEWSKLRDAAQQAFPGEVLARGEIMLYSLGFVEAVPHPFFRGIDLIRGRGALCLLTRLRMKSKGWRTRWV